MNIVIICPYCKHENSGRLESTNYSPNTDAFEQKRVRICKCEHCGLEFIASVEISAKVRTQKVNI